MLASVGQNIPRLIWASLKKERKSCLRASLPPRSLFPSCVLFLQILSQGSADVPALLVEVTPVREAAAAAEAAHVTAALVVETSA
jgi:hypothetical protein